MELYRAYSASSWMFKQCVTDSHCLALGDGIMSVMSFQSFYRQWENRITSMMEVVEVDVSV